MSFLLLIIVALVSDRFVH